MTNKFDIAIVPLLKAEGRFSNHPNDPGGATDYGISLRFLKDYGIDINEDGWITLQDILDLDENKARAIYKQYWWEKYHYENIGSPKIYIKVLDMSVNMGSVQAHKIVQRAANWLGFKLLEDGLLGNKSFQAISDINKREQNQTFLNQIRRRQAAFYRTIAEEKPKLQVFLKGWLNRAAT